MSICQHKFLDHNSFTTPIGAKTSATWNSRVLVQRQQPLERGGPKKQTSQPEGQLNQRIEETFLTFLDIIGALATFSALYVVGTSKLAVILRSCVLTCRQMGWHRTHGETTNSCQKGVVHKPAICMAEDPLSMGLLQFQIRV